MATSFINATASIGEGDTVVFASPSNTKAILIGCNIANKTNGILPISLLIRNAEGDTYIVKEKRVGNGENEEIMRGNKLVLKAEEQIIARAALDDSFDVIASILTGV